MTTVKRNRKGAKDWRKNIDVSDVQDSIHETQTEARFGGIIKDKSDQDLFAVDAKGNKDQVPFDQPKKLRIDEILKPNSAFSLYSSKKPTQKIGSNESALLKKIAAKPKPQLKSAESKKSFDVWESSPTSKVQASKPQSCTQVPFPGQSYRPLEEDHQECLAAAAEIATALEQRELAERPRDVSHLQFDPTTDQMVLKANAEFIDRQPDDNTQLNANDQTASTDTCSTDINEGEFMRTKRKLDDSVRNTANNKRIKCSKSKKTSNLNLIKAKKLEDLQLAEDIKNIDKIKAEISQINSKSKQKREKSKQSVDKYSLIPVKLSNEIPSTLLGLAPEGDLLTEKFVSFQRRQLINPGKKTKTRVYKNNRKRIIIKSRQ